MKTKKILKLSSLLLVLACSAYADMGQSLEGQKDYSEFEKSLQDVEGESHLYNKEKKGSSYSKYKKNSPFLFGTKQKEANPKLNGKAHYVLGTIAAPEVYKDFSNEEIMKALYDKGDRAFSISYFSDSFDYQDDTGVFSNTYEADSADSIKGGLLMFNWQNYYTKRFLSPFWGAGAGLSYNTGHGRFANGSKSRAAFKLWTVPVDLYVGTDLSLGKYMKLTVFGGPSVMGIWQNRDDKEDGDPKKNKRQISPGYMGTAKLSINFSRMSDNYAFRLYQLSNISNLSMNIEARHHSYNKFQDDFSISGTSFGLGFTFEFL
ncbi:hypothetical protein HBN50_04800 [Halobacteriovorax sp. GB3]|uniref:hypothetical protein n=1 Tax=Halobacteriovorax sp. GB3 TaxID=2719615 RepID=UPI00235E9DB8|nr:hypothetical protein [Halobacteriovorax sp. GB3]MDD0852402.1 hypothetical protein [Halobacteriovorax sp. GB3]